MIDGVKALEASSSKALGGGSQTTSGVLFLTYNTLSSAGSKSSKRTRMEQILDWAGGESFEGALIFDESHRSKNFNANKEENSTKVSQAVIAIQEALPRARVVYASATGLTDVSNMAYACRLGLWGLQTPFPTFLQFKDSMERRGLGALEMLAMELKASGSYVARGLSWAGAEFEVVEAALDAETAAAYDAMCAWFQSLRLSLEHAVRLSGASGACSSKRCADGHVCNPLRSFWSCQMSFFRQIGKSSCFVGVKLHASCRVGVDQL